MSWQAAAWLLLGGSTVLMLLGLPVAFAFMVTNIIGAWFFMGGEPGLVQFARNCVESVAKFSLTPIPMFILMGEVLFHTGLAVKVIEGIERLIRMSPGAWPLWRWSRVPCSRPSPAPPLRPPQC